MLVGDGPDRDRLAPAAHPRAWCSLGTVATRAPWLQAADVVVVPSRWEGQALVLLEAMACGVPVVASDIAANAETLPSTAGATVPATDPAALAAALVERLEPGQQERRSAEGRAGRVPRGGASRSCGSVSCLAATSTSASSARDARSLSGAE